MNLIATGAARTMSSIDLLELVNQARAEFGESEVRRNDFTARCCDELEGEHYETFVVQNHNGTESDALQMSRDQCLYVLMRESKAVRRAVTVKLNRDAAPAELSRMDILRLAMESEEARIRAESALALAAPKVDFVERYVTADTGSKGFRQVAKLLKANEARFREFLLAEKIMYRLGGEWVAHQNHIDAGRFSVKTGEANGHAFNRSLFTSKGVEWVAGEWAKAKVRAEVTA